MDEIKYKDLIIDQSNKLCSINKKPVNLSKKEYELLLFLISNPNRVYSREELLKELWNNGSSIRTVDVAISRLRKKLEEYGTFIVTRQGFGYSFNLYE